MKIKKLWYTMIEMLLVVILVWILWIMFRNSFKPKNKDILYWEACVNNVYADISSFINNALTSKNILSWSERISPEKYFIIINPNDNTIKLEYQRTNSGTIYIYKQISLTWDMPSNYYCQNNSYTMILSWNSTTVEINKWLIENSEFKSFLINNRNSFYEKIFLKLCPNKKWTIDYNKCKEIWIYEIDISTQNIKKSTCLNTATWWNCLERTQ